MSAARARGTRWETTLVEYLREHGFPHVERRANGGAKDRGDLAGIPGLIIEAKSAARVELATWTAEAEAERRNDGAQYGVVWAKRKGKASAAEGYVVLTGAQFVQLLRAAGHGAPIERGGEHDHQR